MAKLKPASEQETAALKAATEELQEGVKAIHTWQKLIRIADRSELGWQVVKAYESDELASDDEDAKCLEKAQKSAEQKKKAATALRGGRNTYRWRTTQPTVPGGLMTASVQQGQHWCSAKQAAQAETIWTLFYLS